MKIEQIIGLIEGERQRFALERLEKPGDKDAFEYGVAVGMLKGMSRVKELIIESLAESNRDRDI